ncbi:glycosyltransferase family 10 domain-containing protein [Anabaena sp. UHCC 0204]|uniref:glycosyltransferase family 10 domain-containing protein n=1 Tax=Anabaena sp. UHCC 0204 TaxID=2590009 RepID=UPI001446C438|nr:glycosyltransferase family 10 [Anabaena sp. UHCC 0204]MTJ09042.1 glycosyltransferase [Anabaena sp. UHCC 0204]
MKTIGMISSYDNLNKRGDWLWQQTPNEFGIWENIQMQALAKKPDFLLMYQFDFPKPPSPQSLLDRLRNQPKKTELNINSLLRGISKERIIYLLREPPLSEIVEINKYNYQQADNYCGYISGPDDFAPIPDYMPAIWYLSNSFRELDEMPPFKKVKTCSWITSGINRTENHQKRLNFLQSLQNSNLEIDFYGRNLPSWSKDAGELGGKCHGMSPYYYNLAIENYADNDWYVSEKLWDSLLAWCLPIYYGGSAADKLLPPGSFLRLPSLDEKGIAYIQEVTSSPDAWHDAKEAIAEARQIILHKLNLLNWLSEFVAKFS